MDVQLSSKFSIVFYTFSSIEKPCRQKHFHYKVTNTEFLHVRTFPALAFSCAFTYLLGSYWYLDKYFEILICRAIIELGSKRTLEISTESGLNEKNHALHVIL